MLVISRIDRRVYSHFTVLVMMFVVVVMPMLFTEGEEDLFSWYQTPIKSTHENKSILINLSIKFLSNIRLC